MINEEELKTELSFVKGKRKDNRKKLIENFCLNFLTFCKQRGTLSFTRENLSFLSNGNLKRSCEDKTITEILNLLIDKKIIVEDSIKKYFSFFRNKPLVSFDYGSYNLLLKHNGYKKHLYQEGFNTETKRFFKIHKGSFNLGEKIQTDEEYNAIETRSKKANQKQACFDNGNLSVVLQKFFVEEKVYRFL